MRQATYTQAIERSEGAIVTASGPIQRAAGFVDDRRPEAVAQRRLIELIAESPRVVAQRAQLSAIYGIPAQAKAEDAPDRGGLSNTLEAGVEGTSVNDDEGLETEADVMGARAASMTGPGDQPISQRKVDGSVSSRPAKSLNAANGRPVVQLRWIDHPGTNQSHWEGRRAPTRRDLRSLASRGRVQVENRLEALPSRGEPTNRANGLFLAPHDAPRGTIGAPFPLRPRARGETEPVRRSRRTNVSWPHDGRRVHHPEDRRSERTIHGGSARNELTSTYGMPDYPRAAWAHIQPDHATPLGEDREDRANRHPSTEAANQQHTVREYAQSRVAREHGVVIASRTLEGERPERPGLFSSMEFGTSFLTGNSTRTHRDSVPYFTQQPGRYGDEVAHRNMLSLFGINALASSLRDDGMLSTEDVPDRFYVRDDESVSEGSPLSGDEEESMAMDAEQGATVDEEGEERDESQSTEMNEEPSGTSDAPRSGSDGALAPAGAPAGALPGLNGLNAGQMVVLYHAEIAWANAQGTYSHEFHFVRDHPATARLVLVNGGMDAGEAQAFTNAFALEIAQHAGAAHGYVAAPVQQLILQQLGADEQLLAIIRFLRHGG